MKGNDSVEYKMQLINKKLVIDYVFINIGVKFLITC